MKIKIKLKSLDVLDKNIEHNQRFSYLLEEKCIDQIMGRFNSAYNRGVI